MTWGDALAIGLAQMFAIIPGVSRSGSTITAGRALRLHRESAAVFSFLMSMPIIAAASILKLPHVLKTEGLTPPLDRRRARVGDQRLARRSRCCCASSRAAAMACSRRIASSSGLIVLAIAFSR